MDKLLVSEEIHEFYQIKIVWHIYDESEQAIFDSRRALTQNFEKLINKINKQLKQIEKLNDLQETISADSEFKLFMIEFLTQIIYYAVQFAQKFYF